MPPPQRGSPHAEVSAFSGGLLPVLGADTNTVGSWWGRSFFGAAVSRHTVTFLIVGAGSEAKIALMNVYLKTSPAPVRFAEHWFSMICLGMACLGFVLVMVLAWRERTHQQKCRLEADTRPEAPTSPKTNADTSPAADPPNSQKGKPPQPMLSRSSEVSRSRRSTRRQEELAVVSSPPPLSEGESEMLPPVHETATASASSLLPMC